MLIRHAYGGNSYKTLQKWGLFGKLYQEKQWESKLCLLSSHSTKAVSMRRECATRMRHLEKINWFFLHSSTEHLAKQSRFGYTQSCQYATSKGREWWITNLQVRIIFSDVCACKIADDLELLMLECAVRTHVSSTWMNLVIFIGGGWVRRATLCSRTTFLYNRRPFRKMDENVGAFMIPFTQHLWDKIGRSWIAGLD